GWGGEGVERVREALTVLDKAEERLDQSDRPRVASVHLARGIALSALSELEADHLTRPSHLSSALSHIERSIEMHATPSAHYHLALLLARPLPGRDVERAVESARRAVEGEPGEDDPPIAASASDEDATTPPPASEPISVLPAGAKRIPPASTLLAPLPDHPPPTPSERLYQATQLRISLMALTELTDGAEGAGERWVEVFGWFAERSKGVRGVGESRRGSMDTARSRAVSVNTAPNGHVGVVEGGGDGGAQGQPDGIAASQSVQAQAQVQASPDINITPPSPGASGQISHSHSHSLDHDEHDHTRRSSDSGGKKVQRILQNQVSKGSQRVSSISKKMASGVTGVGRGRRRGVGMARTSSLSSEFYSGNGGLDQYQASSIHSRRTYSPFASMQNLSTPPSPSSTP
ncbi:unnamed protein product, partial [Peniophora sp. CBMAI 1063]